MPARPLPYRLNFLLLLGLECCWAFGTWLAHPLTVMPDYLLRLGATPRLVSVLPVLWAIGTGVGALLVGAVVAHRSRLAAFTGVAHLIAALPWLGLAGIAAAADRGWLTHTAALGWSLVALLVFDLIIGFLLQVYFTLISRVFPERGRGRWLGALFALSSFVGVLAPVLAARTFIREDCTLASYAAIFLCSFVLFVVGALPAFFLTERGAAPLPRRSFTSNARVLWRLWRGNHGLRRYLLSLCWLQWGALCLAFVATYGRLEAGLSEHVVTWLGTLVVLIHAMASLGVGWVLARLERRGHPVRQLYLGAQWAAQAVSLCALAFAAFGPAPTAAVLLAVAAGLRMCAEFVVHPNILLESGPRASRTDMLTLGAIVLMPATALIQPAAGAAIALAGHRSVFALVAALAAPALVALWRQVERAGR